MPTQAPPDYQSYPPGQPGGPPPRRDPERRAKLVDYALKGLGLLGVALVSGFLWYLIRNNPAPTNGGSQTAPPSQPAGLYQFQAFEPATTETDCAAHSTNEVQNYLQKHTCVSMTRSLYTTNLPNGQKVVTSIVVVKMDSAATAKGLQQISDGAGTGHVKDLVEDGTVIPGGPKGLQDGGYFSAVRGARMVVVMTEYVDVTLDNSSNLGNTKDTLIGVGEDAVKQGVGLS